MSRSGYSEELDNWELIRWRGAVKAGIRGKRGQALLTELADSMDKMRVKSLIAHALEADGEYCALGVVGNARGIDMSNLDPDESTDIAKAFNISEALAMEIVYLNDEWCPYRDEAPSGRWVRMRSWVENNII